MINIVGCGWLGKALGKRLNEKGYHVHGSTTSEANLAGLHVQGIAPYLLRLGNRPKDSTRQMPTAKVAVILLSPKVIVPNIEELTQELHEAGTTQLILASTSGVYPNTNQWVSEDDAVHKVSPHSGIDVFAMENSIIDDPRFETMVLRFSGLYGPDREPGHFLRSTEPYPGGNNPVNLVHQEDCVRALFLALISFMPGRRFNICADKHPTREEFYTRAAQKLAVDSPLFGDPAITPHKYVSNRLFKEMYGFHYLHADPMADVSAGSAPRT